jgi:hypothetical protein
MVLFTSPCPESDESNPQPPTYFSNIHSNIILPSALSSSKFSLTFMFQTKSLYAFLTSSTRATSPTHLILLDLITLIQAIKVTKDVTQYIE